MAYEVLWTERAEDDLDAIVSYVAGALGSPRAASDLLDGFDALAEALSATPEMRAVSATPALARRGLRAYPVGGYVALYSFDGERVVIFRVVHQRQDYARLIGG